MSRSGDLIYWPPMRAPKIYAQTFLVYGTACLVLYLIWEEYVLLEFSDLNRTGLSLEGLGSVWFIFAWITGTKLLSISLNGRPVITFSKPAAVARGLWLSANAGFWEELIYRWILFFSAMIGLPFLNWLTLGFVRWVYSELLVPLANWSTFGALEPFLLDSSSWVLGAAIVSASIAFRDAHSYQGLIGWAVSWFGGMVMFWLVLNYGLLTAMAAHVLYNGIYYTLEGAFSRKPSGLEQALMRVLR